MSSNTRKSRQSTNQTEEVTVSAQRGSANFGGDVDGYTTAVEISEYSEADAALAQISDTGLPRWLPTTLYSEYEAVLAIFEHWGLSSDKPYQVDIKFTYEQLLAQYAGKIGKNVTDEEVIYEFACKWDELTQWQGHRWCQKPIQISIGDEKKIANDPCIIFRELAPNSYHRVQRGIKFWAILAMPGVSKVVEAEPPSLENPKGRKRQEYPVLTRMEWQADPYRKRKVEDTTWVGVAREFESLFAAKDAYDSLWRTLQKWDELPKGPADLEVPDPIRMVGVRDRDPKPRRQVTVFKPF